MEVFLFITLTVVMGFHFGTGACPTHCKAGQTCDTEDSGCSECDQVYYGRQCQHRMECRHTAGGAEYRGLRNTTNTGKICQRWDSQSPHPHTRSGEENYCRNPDGEPEPWCYTIDPGIRYELCGVKMCNTLCLSPPLKAPGVDVTNPPSDGFAVGFNAVIGCTTGYETSGSPATVTVTCQSSLTWTQLPLPTCSRIVCPTPSLAENSHVSNGKLTYKYKDQMTIECSTGYTLQGQSTLTCQADKSWNPSVPTCKINECPAPGPIAHGSILDPKAKYVYGDFVNVKCVTGYTLQEQKKMTCQADKMWSTAPTCKINECPSLMQIPNGSMSSNKATYLYQETVTITCNSGYILKGQEKMTCQADKTWTNAPTCEKVKCPQPSIANSKVSNQKPEYEYQDSMKIVCDTGYTLQGQDTLTCQEDKSWSPPLPSCKINECTSPQSVQNGSLSGTKPKYVYEDKVTIVCDIGFTVTGQKTIQCQANKTWTTAPTCDIRKCASPTPLLNSNITNNTSVYEYRDVIVIGCNVGYTLQGPSKLLCQANGTWDMEMPTCKVVECSPPDSLPASLFIKQPSNLYVYGDIMTLSCQGGHTMKGKDTIVCKETKEWSKPIPVCEKNEKESDSSAVIGGVVGSLAAVLVILVLVGLLIWRRKRKENKSSTPMVFHDIENLDINKKVAESKVDNVYANVSTNEDPSDDTYYNVGPVKDIIKIQIENLKDYMLLKNNVEHFFEEEFKSLPVGLQRPTETAMRQKNRPKNKYKNIYPYDDNRICLKQQPGVPDSDYINASPIKGYEGKVKYIAAQGPQDFTYGDFWRMVVEQKIKKIVMLTNPFENGAKKCIQYWPDEDSLVAGRITVELQSSDEFADYTIRRLKLTQDGDTAFVHQYHFTTWPDKGVPKCPSVLAQFHRKVCEMPVQGSGPILIHCSAGIGRTGTFIALDYLLDEALATGSVGVRQALEVIREERVNMVQTKEQYIFLHNVLIEALELRSSIITASDFPQKYKRLLTRNRASGKTSLQQEYETLKESTSYPTEDACLVGKRETNKAKNRYSNILPTDENRVSLSASHIDDSYINAVYLPGYRNRHAYIITQTPLSNTMDLFWKLIFDESITSIVMMNQETHQDEKYWPEVENTPMHFGDINVTLLCLETETNFQTLSFEICRDKEKHVVKQYQALFWSDAEPAPTSTSPMLQLIDTVQTWAHQNENRPILVHCMNGAEKSGLFCSAMAFLDRLKSDQDVFIQPVIKQFRTIRPQIIPNMEQFGFCYDLVGAYIDSFETYSNFL